MIPPRYNCLFGQKGLELLSHFCILRALGNLEDIPSTRALRAFRPSRHSSTEEELEGAQGIREIKTLGSFRHSGIGETLLINCRRPFYCIIQISSQSVFPLSINIFFYPCMNFDLPGDKLRSWARVTIIKKNHIPSTTYLYPV